MKESFKSVFRLSSESSEPETQSYLGSADSVSLITFLRWSLPLCSAILAIGYVLFEQGILQGHSILDVHVIRTLIVVGLISPALVWLALIWAEKATLRAANTQRALTHRTRELAALNAIGQATAQSLELGEITQIAIAKIIELFDLDAVELRLLERDSLVLQAHHGVSTDFVMKESSIGLGECLCGKCASTGEVQFAKFLQASPTPSKRLCAREGFQSSLSVPMKSKSQVIGVIHLASKKEDAFSQTDQEMLEAIGNRVATAIENSILYKQTKRRVIQLQTTSLIGQELTTHLDPEHLFSAVVRLVQEKFGYYHTGIWLSDTNSGELVLKEASGAGAKLIKLRGLRLKIGQDGITGWVAHTGQAFLCNDVSKESRYYRAEGPRDTRAELAVPLRVGNQVIGVLDVQNNKANSFDKQDVTILQILGNQLGIAIENARLFQETRQRYNAMIALHETSLDMISQLDMPELLQALLRRGVQLIGAHAAVLFLYDPTRNLISSRATFNTYHDFSQATWTPGEGLIGRVIETGKPLIVNDYEHWDGKELFFANSHLRHPRALGVPLLWQNKVIGGMNVLNQATERPFNQNDLWLANLFADLAAIAVKNAEFHTQIKVFSQDLEHKVIERTKELLIAKEEIASKAQQLSSLLKQTLRIREEERARIARDLHDSIIQIAVATKYEIQAAQVAGGESLPLSTQNRLNSAIEALDDIGKEIQHTIYDLHPAMLDSVGLVPALQKYGKRFQEISGIVCDVQVMGIFTRLAPPNEISIYRLVEEALHNVATHAKAKVATIVIDFEPNMLCITIQDDGQGFDYRQWMKNHTGKHLGLIGMRERVESLTGEMKLWSEPGQGTRVTFLIPNGKEEVDESDSSTDRR